MIHLATIQLVSGDGGKLEGVYLTPNILPEVVKRHELVSHLCSVTASL